MFVMIDKVAALVAKTFARQQSKLHLLCILLLASITPSAHAAITGFDAGMLNAGNGPYSSATAKTTSTNDQILYVAAFKGDGADTNLVLRLKMPSTTGAAAIPGGGMLPTTNVGPIPVRSIYFKQEELIGCLNKSTSPVASGSNANSGVTADGLEVVCLVDPIAGAKSINFKMNIVGDVPNGTVQKAPVFTIESTQQSTIIAPGVPTGTGASQIYGLPDLTVKSMPTWNMSVEVGRQGPQFLTHSGPTGTETGYIIAYNIGLWSNGSKKGQEALNTNSLVINDNYSNPTIPGAQLVTWKLPPGVLSGTDFTPSGLNGCLNSGNIMYVADNFSNVIDNNKFALYPIISAFNGGICSLLAPPTNTATTNTAQLGLTGTDFTLINYPTRKGYSSSAKYLVDSTNPDNPNNEWWVASKDVFIWIPLNSVPVTGSNPPTGFVNSIALVAKSITNQNNVDPIATDDSVTAYINRIPNGGAFSNHWRPGNTLAGGVNPSPPCDPSVDGDCYLQSATPLEQISGYTLIANQGTDSIINSVICGKFDNSRLTFSDIRSMVLDPNNARSIMDPNTGVISYSDHPDSDRHIKWSLGVGGGGHKSRRYMDIF